MECAEDGNTKLPEAAPAVVLRYQIDHLRVAVTNVHPDREVKPADLFVKRIKIGIGDQPVSFDAAHEYAAGPVLLAKLEFLSRCAPIQQRQNANPSEPSLPLPVNVGEPTVIALGNGDFPLNLVS